MDLFENIISALDVILDSERKRHITGGILLSASALFSGLAITVMTIKNDGDSENKEEELYEDYFEE
ncbi:MAG: histidine kinase [Clostridia bacterium]|nr:histidine kinase [Clostridia bacterium]